MIKYNIRSRQLLDVVNEMRIKKLIISPYFQRNLVWRTIHKIDFIKTILMGLPFPEIFIAKGDLDIEEMTATSCVVDGQQRLNSILEFISNEFAVDGQFYSKLTAKEKEGFLKYEIAVIELDIKHDDPLIQEMFKRLNRTYYSLSNIERLSTEYAPSEFMLVAKLISKEINFEQDEDENPMGFDPNITQDFIEWAKTKKLTNINRLILDSHVFSTYEISRKIHLNFVLNILGTITVGFFNRNLRKEVLDQFAENFPDKNEIVYNLEMVASKINKLKLKKDSYWYNKANMFSLIIVFYNYLEELSEVKESLIKEKLQEFEDDIPEAYQIAAKEGVNNKKERLIRNEHLEELIDEILSE